MDSNDKNMLDWIKKIPKTEIHIHAEATVSIQTYIDLNKKYQIDETLLSEKDYKDRLNFTNLSDMIEFFLYLQTFFQEDEDFELLCQDVIDYAVRNRIYYLEIFLSPTGIINNGRVDVKKVLRTLSDRFTEYRESTKVTVKTIVDVSRTFGPENAMNNLNMVLEYLDEYKDPNLIGIGLGGAEMGNSAALYKDVFEKAREANLYTVAHAGEEVDSQSIWDAVKTIGAQRIGHGTSAMNDAELRNYLIEHKTPIEICPISNVVTKKYVQDIRNHPIRGFFDEGLNVTVNTDDPVLFSTSLVSEYYNLYKYLGFSKDDLIQVLKNGLYSTFMSTEKKDELWKQVENYL